MSQSQLEANTKNNSSNNNNNNNNINLAPNAESKGPAVQAWRGCEGSSISRPSDFKTTAT
jgi:hypothetical protein